MKFNEKLIELRKQKGLSQEALGYELNVTRQTISKWELGVSTPEMDKLVELSKYFNISLDTLINDSINLNNTSSTVNSSSQTINPEFVGVSSEYIPEDVKTKTYVSEPKKRTKVSFYLLIAIPFIIAIAVAILAFSNMGKMMDKAKSTKDDLLSSSQEKKEDMSGTIKDLQESTTNTFQDSAESIIEDAQNSINDSKEESTDTTSTNSTSTTLSFEVRSFNSGLEVKEGATNAFFVKTIFDDIIDKPDEVKEIVVVYNDIEASSEKELLDLQKDFDNVDDIHSNNYVVSFEYADEGYINKVIIEDK